MYRYVFVIVIFCALQLGAFQIGIGDQRHRNRQNDQYQGQSNSQNDENQGQSYSQNDENQGQSNSQNAERTTAVNETATLTNHHDTTLTIDKNDQMQTIYLYVGIGVGVLILFALQTIGLIMYFNRVKLRRVNEIARNLMNTTSNGRGERVRYSRQPLNRKAKKIETEDDTNEYECLADLQRPPTPPPLGSIPRNTIPATPSPSLRSQKKEIREQNSIKNRGPMPLPCELPTPGTNMNSLPVRKRPKTPPPIESKPMVTTLPSKWRPIAAVPVLKPTTALHTPNYELMAKLKMRAEKNAILEESHQSPIPTRGSTRPLPPKPKPVPPPPVTKSHYELEENYDSRDSTSSDNEWTMEPLTPYNIYNV